MGDFNVFDEWGNYVGKFSPSGGGSNGCLFMLALFTIGLVIFAVYALLKMAVIGLSALAQGDTKTAIKNLILPVLILAILIMQTLLVNIAQVERQNNLNKLNVAVQEARSNPNAVTITKIGKVSINEVCAEPNTRCPTIFFADLGFEKYLITNNASLDLIPEVDNSCVVGGWDLRSQFVLRSKQTMTLYCDIGYLPNNIKFYVSGLDWTSLPVILLSK